MWWNKSSTQWGRTKRLMKSPITAHNTRWPPEGVSAPQQLPSTSHPHNISQTNFQSCVYSCTVKMRSVSLNTLNYSSFGCQSTEMYGWMIKWTSQHKLMESVWSLEAGLISVIEICFMKSGEYTIFHAMSQITSNEVNSVTFGKIFWG